MILSFFAALTNEGWGIWIVILIHCLLMALIFRPQKYDTEAAKEITWMRKFFLALSLVFTQVFTYLPFKREPSTRWRYAVVYYSVHFNLVTCVFTVLIFTNLILISRFALPKIHFFSYFGLLRCTKVHLHIGCLL